MKVMLAEYVNVRRAEMALWLLAKEKQASLVPLTGSFSLMDSGVKCVTENVAVLAVPKDGITPILVKTANSATVSKAPKELSSVLEKRDTLYQQLVRLCKAKFAISKNQFAMECASEGCTLSISSNSDESISCVVKSPVGDAFMQEGFAVANILAECKSIKSFSFKMVTEQCEKDVCVRRGQIEIFRELSHYLNRTLVLTSLTSSDEVDRILCVSNAGCCEMRVAKNTRAKFRKVPFTKTVIDSNAFAFTIDAQIDKIIGATSLSEVVGRGNECYK